MKKKKTVMLHGGVFRGEINMYRKPIPAIPCAVGSEGGIKRTRYLYVVGGPKRPKRG